MTFDVSFPLMTMNSSGGVRMALHVANALATRGLRVAVTAPAGETPLTLDARVTAFTRAGGRRAFVSALPAARVYVATGYQTPMLIAAGRLLREPRARIAYLIQGDEITSHVMMGTRPTWLKPALRLAARAGYHMPARRIAVSRFVADRVGAGRIHRVIPPGIEDSYLSAPAPPRAATDAPVVGVIANPARAKGTRFALDAFAALGEHGGVRLVAFHGIHSLALPACVQPFSPPASRDGKPATIADFYRTCDIFVFPSLVEGFGLPPLEAMACGAAVVVSDCGGVREYARDEENCLVVAPGSADAITGAVRRLAGDDALRARLCRGGRATAARFTAARFANECATEIEQLLRERGGNRD